MTDFVKPFTLSDEYFFSSKEKLQNSINELFKSVVRDYNYTSRAIFVPHSKYSLSGNVSANVFQYFKNNLSNIFVIAPAHFLMFHGLYLPTFDMWETPLGNVSINRELLSEINEKFDADYNNRAFENEHDIDVQLPFIQTILPDAKIVPILFGSSNYTFLLRLLNEYWDDKNNGFVFVHNLSHFFSEITETNRSEIILEDFLQSGETLPNNGLRSKSLIAVTEFARERNFSLVRVGLDNCSEISIDSNQISYGAWFLAEECLISFIKEQFSDVVYQICKNAIRSRLFNTEFTDIPTAPVFKTRGGAFVEIFQNDQKCAESGTFFADRTFYEDLVQNSVDAAIQASNILQKEQLKKIQVKIYLISRPTGIAFNSEDSLLNQIDPDKDGLIFLQNDTYDYIMPGRCREFPDKREFIKDVARILGNDKNIHSKLMYVFKFRAIKIECPADEKFIH